MSRGQWGNGYHKGMAKGVNIGESAAQMDFGMKALCLATAVRDAQKKGCVSQYVLMEVLIDLLSEETGGRLTGGDDAEK